MKQTDTRPVGRLIPNHMTRPGETAWRAGASRATMERLNREAGYPCYCSAVWGGCCDFCAGLAALDGARAEEQRRHQTQEGAR